MSDRAASHTALRIAAFALALVACFTADSASAYCRMTTEGGAQIGDKPCVEKGAKLRWNNPCLSYAVDGDGSDSMDLADIEDAVNSSFAKWQEADCGGGSTPNLIFQPSLQPSTCKRAEFNTTGNVNTIAFLDPWKDPCADADDPGYDQLALAVTIVWHNTTTGEIFDADMMINDEPANPPNDAGGPYATCPLDGCPEGTRANPGPADLNSIVTHEAGHFIGIGHSEVKEATMYASAVRTSVQKRTLAPDDVEAVCAIYPPGNLNESCIAVPMGGLQLDCEVTEEGNPIACDGPASAPSSGGCSTIQAGGDTWATVFLASFGLMAWRRRSSRRGARS